MTDTETKTPSSGPQGNPGATSTPSNTPASQPPTHRVKKLLESYIGSAGRTLSGPADSPLENDVLPAYKRMQYKLPPDVELSKSMGDDNMGGGGGDGDMPPEKIKAMMAGEGEGNAPVRERSSQNVHPEKLMGNNGMVTLSRIEDGKGGSQPLPPSSQYNSSRHALPGNLSSLPSGHGPPSRANGPHTPVGGPHSLHLLGLLPRGLPASQAPALRRQGRALATAGSLRQSEGTNQRHRSRQTELTGPC